MTDRGRVPFALIGVLLLVGSATYAGSMDRHPVREPRVQEAMDGYAAGLDAALREASRTAALRAAERPVIDPANTTAGRALDRDAPFRDALRLRVYTRLRGALDRMDHRSAGVVLSATLPTPETTADLRAARDRVTVARARLDGTALRVRVHDVTVTAVRDGRVVARGSFDPEVVVDVPTLAVHGRVGRFERQLNAGPLDPGLGRRLTAALYPVAWARGYAQYGGAPIGNVVGNRHVALVANGAVLDLQRAAFGSSDPVGRRALRRATARTGVTDLLAASDDETVASLKRSWRNASGPSPLPERKRIAGRARAVGSAGESELTVRVGTTAEDAFLETADRLEATLERVYTARVRRTVRVRRLGSRWLSRAPPPADGTLVDERTETSVSVTEREGSTRRSGDGWHPLARAHRAVTREVTRTRVWRTPSGRETTQSRRIERLAVDVVLQGRHDGGDAPARPVAGVHTPGGPLGGPNLAGVGPVARERLVSSPGGADAVAAAAAERVAGGTGTATAERRITGERPAGLRDWVYADLAGLRREVRNLSVTLDRREVSTFGVNPAARLRARLDARRETLLDAPARYDGVADRARIAARAAYLERVDRRLEARAEARRDRRRAVSGRLPGNGSTLQRAYTRRFRRPTGGSPALAMTVDARPSYLTMGAVGTDTVPALPEGASGHPLAVRNTNVVTVPYGEAAGAIVDAFTGPDRVPLRTAAQVLAASEAGRHLDSRPSGARLSEEVAAGVDAVEAQLVGVLAEAGLGGRSSRQAVVNRGLGRWQGPAARALALANGSAGRAVHRVAVREWGLSGRTADELRLRIDRTVRRGLADRRVRVSARVTNRTARSLREAVRSEVRSRVESRAKAVTERGLERAGERIADRVGERLPRGLLSDLPAGVPVAPAPGLWYLTVNVWRVEVRGTYAQFVIRVPRGAPDAGGFRYVRDGGAVGLDVDGDGRRERLGTASRVSFETGTVVAVGVPPGPRGVGDVDGVRTEESEGWPDPGWK